jgi:hypothetical protein
MAYFLHRSPVRDECAVHRRGSPGAGALDRLSAGS